MGAAISEASLNGGATVVDRLLKAYLAAEVIPDAAMQTRALIRLSIALAARDHLDEAVACAVLATRKATQSRYDSYETSLPALLSGMIAQHGREEISRVLQNVETKASEVLGSLIKKHSLVDFVDKLKLKQSTAGDHW